MDTNIFHFGLYLLLISIFSFLIKKEKIRSKRKVLKTLKESNQIILSKTFKLSLFNDSLINMKNDLSQLLESNDNIKANSLFRLENSMDELIHEKGIWQEYKIQFEKNYPDFSNNLYKKCPNLSVNDYKHATFVRLNMSAKDVANLTNTSFKTVDTARYRLKKRLNLSKEVSLSMYLKSI